MSRWTRGKNEVEDDEGKQQKCDGCGGGRKTNLNVVYSVTIQEAALKLKVSVASM